MKLRQLWPLPVLAALWALWPLLWLLISAPSLSRQEPHAAQLFAAAPKVYFTGQAAHFSTSGGGFGGHSLLRRQQDLQPLAAAQGWTFTYQMGAGFFFVREGRRAVATCEGFSRGFSACKVSPD